MGEPMIKIFVKLLIISGVIIWSINAHASKCVQGSAEKPRDNAFSGIFVVDTLNVRSGSGMQFCIKRVLKNVKGKYIKVLGSLKDWQQVSIEGQHLWVHKSLIRPIPSINLELI